MRLRLDATGFALLALLLAIKLPSVGLASLSAIPTLPPAPRHLRRRQALDLAFPQQPAEAALLDLLPPPEQQASAAASNRPSLASMLRHYEKKRQQDEEDAGSAAGGSAAGGAAATAGTGGGAAAQHGGSVPQRAAADLANELQFTLQQAEEAALREKRAAEEREQEEQEQQQLQGKQGKHQGKHQLHRGSGRGSAGAAAHGSADDDGSSAYQELAGSLLRRGIQRRPLELKPAGGIQASTDAAAPALGSGVRMLVGVISACCTEKAAERRAIVRDTWARTIREVGGDGLRKCTAWQMQVCAWVADWLRPASACPASAACSPALVCLLSGVTFVHASSPLCNLQSHPGIDLRFFLAQPPDAETAQRWLPALQVLCGWRILLLHSLLSRTLLLITLSIRPDAV